MDGELMRRGVNIDLGYSTEDRSENLRRSAHIAKLFNDAGLICVAAFLAPSESVRQRVADVVGRERFLVVYCSADESTRKARDTKGHYADAASGKLTNFPGVSAPYEAPENADLVLDTGKLSIEESVQKILDLLQSNDFIKTI
jgi:bifunctional enzyme CysN/CysC